VKRWGHHVTMSGFLVFLVFPVSAHTQDLELLVAHCASGGTPSLLAACSNALLAGQALQGGITIADAAGTELPGTSSTIGGLFGRSPRVSLATSIRAAFFEMPDVHGQGTDGQGTNTVTSYGLKGTVVIGVLDGFSISPTVGGIFSLDLLGSLGLLLLDERDGFTDNQTVMSGGMRLGLFRESFTMPGFTISVVQRYGGAVGWGNTGSLQTQIDTDVSATSVRATVGNDLFALALLAGIGWDWSKGALGVQVTDPVDRNIRGVASTDNLISRRDIYFIGMSVTRFILQVSLEAGWAGGYSNLPGYQGAYDSGRRAPFMGLAGRITL